WLKIIGVTLTAKCERATKPFRPPLPIRPKRCAMEAALPGGELAGGGLENGYAASVAPISGWRKVFCDGSKADSPKVFVPGGNSYPLHTRLLKKSLKVLLKVLDGVGRCCLMACGGGKNDRDNSPTEDH